MIGIHLGGTAPIHEQLTEGIENLILKGLLEKDSPLPSVRELACELAVNPNTIQKAYTVLEQNGITYSVNGKGRYVGVTAEEMRSKKTSALYEKLKSLCGDLAEYGESVSEIKAKLDEFNL